MSTDELGIRNRKRSEAGILKRKLAFTEIRFVNGEKWAAVEALAISIRLNIMPPEWASAVFLAAYDNLVLGCSTEWTDVLPKYAPRGKQGPAHAKKMLFAEYLKRNVQHLRTMKDPLTKKRMPIDMPLFEVMADEFHQLHPHLKKMTADNVSKLFYELKNNHLIRFEEMQYSPAGK